MKTKSLRALGILLGLALFTVTGLIVTVGQRPATPPQASRTQPPSERAIAPALALSDAFADVSERVKPCVVTVYSARIVKLPQFNFPFGDFPFRWFFGDEDTPRPRRQQPQREYRQSGMGSGIVIDREGRIVTNYHVVEDVTEIKVKFPNGGTFDAEVVGADADTDLAVIKLKGNPPRDLVVAALGDSDVLRVGDWVLAIGAPFELEQTVTAGIISAKGRGRLSRDSTKYQDFLQTDAAINPGNSGGPLVNMRGEVVGINTAIVTGTGAFAGVGFAIPVNMAKHVIHDLVASGKVTRGYLGVGIQDIGEFAEQFGLRDTKGAVVTQVAKGSPADKAGLRVGDVIRRFNGHDVNASRELRNIVADTAPDTKAEILVVRDSRERRLTVTVGRLNPETAATATAPGEEQESETGPTAQFTRFGLAVGPLPPANAQELGLDPNEGVLVTDVDDDSPAAHAGIQPDDVIVEVNRARVSNIDSFRAAIGKNRDNTLLLVKRKSASWYAFLRANGE
jgi:serine protease Do